MSDRPVTTEDMIAPGRRTRNLTVLEFERSIRECLDPTHPKYNPGRVPRLRRLLTRAATCQD